MPSEPTDWWVIRETELLRALRDAFDGGDPDLVLMELLANSDVQSVGGDDAEQEA